jgi:uncharacterized membrane protein YbhN (UPF0104 family)
LPSPSPSRRSRRGKLVRWGITLASAAALAYAARDLDVRATLASIRGVDPLLGLAAALVMLLCKVGFKTVRTQILLDEASVRVPCASPPLAVTARLLVASHAAGQLAWGPLGFTVRTVALRDGGMPLGAVARAHVAERIAEAFGLAVVAAVALCVEPAAIAGSWLGRILLAALALAVLATAALAASHRLRARLRTYAGSGRALARATAWALASSVADLTVLALAARGMHVDAGVAPILLAFLAVNGACAVPVTPAQLGVQESAIVVAFATAGIASPQALACALAYRAAHIVPLVLVGVPALVKTWATRPVTSAAAA